ncbi:MAG: hypothetical protein EOO01_17250 [Chitinophagaceae bacterium]|nr:MAG: hypothetical protein EOO01_17250 [Chitinophagaceae bacterium]
MSSLRKIFVLAGSSLMILMLLWLTVSAPFVNASRQERARQEKKVNTASPLAGSEEEKVPSSSSVNEYLHENEELQHPAINITAMYKSHQPGLYIAFHGELVSPPPEA